MNDLWCYRCGNHYLYAVEFRNTATCKILVGQEEVDLICPQCGLVVYAIKEGRAERVQRPLKKWWHRIKVWIKHFKGSWEG